MNKYILTFYDLEDNIVAQFDSYKEAAKYFQTSISVVRCNVSRRNLHFPNRKKYDKANKTWGYLIKDNLRDLPTI